MSGLSWLGFTARRVPATAARVVFFILGTLVFVSVALAQEKSASVVSEKTAAERPAALAKFGAPLDQMGSRLRRGTANAGLGWLELPVGVQDIGNKHGIGAAATWGVLQGAGRAVQRTAVGLFEIVTFPFSLTQDNKPLIEPEFVFNAPKPEPDQTDPTAPSSNAV